MSWKSLKNVFKRDKNAKLNLSLFKLTEGPCILIFNPVHHWLDSRYRAWLYLLWYREQHISYFFNCGRL